MRRYTTTINLDEETAELVNHIPNFSLWVRNQLRQEAGKAGVGVHSQAPDVRIRGMCNPMGKEPCRVCWPEGAPSKDDWLLFRSGKIDQIDSSYQERMKHFTQQSFADNVSKKESSDAISNDVKSKKRGFWRFLLQRIV